VGFLPIAHFLTRKFSMKGISDLPYPVIFPHKSMVE